LNKEDCEFLISKLIEKTNKKEKRIWKNRKT
jgi:hypothetical protein